MEIKKDENEIYDSTSINNSMEKDFLTNLFNTTIISELSKSFEDGNTFNQNLEKAKKYFYSENNPELSIFSLLLLPCLNMKINIESQKEKMSDAIIAVYGAAAIPLKRRINTLKQLSNNVDLSNGIIFSGGRSWTSIVPNNFKVTDDEINAYSFEYTPDDITSIIKKSQNHEELDEDDKSKLVLEVRKTDELYEQLYKKYSEHKKQNNQEINFSDWLSNNYFNSPNWINDTFINQNNESVSITSLFKPKERIASLIKKEKINEYWYNLKAIQTMDRRVNEFLEKFPDLKKLVLEDERKIWEELHSDEPYVSYDDMVSKYLESKIEEVYNDRVLLLLCKQKYDDEQKNNTNIQSFDKWLPEFVKTKYIEHIIKHKITEVDLMKLSYGETQDPIIEDDKSTNSFENAVNSLKYFLDQKEENPNINKLIVISEWPYLLRQVNTTKQAAELIAKKSTNPEDPEYEEYSKYAKYQEFLQKDLQITGYPADIKGDISINLLIGELVKILTYKDVGGYQVNEDSINQKMQELIKIIIPDSNTPTSDSDIDYRQYLSDILKGISIVKENQKSASMYDIISDTVKSFSEHNQDPYSDSDSR